MKFKFVIEYQSKRAYFHFWFLNLVPPEPNNKVYWKNIVLTLSYSFQCIRIMKDLVRRDPVWGSLSDWTIELLVERCLYSAWRPLNPAAR